MAVQGFPWTAIPTGKIYQRNKISAEVPQGEDIDPMKTIRKMIYTALFMSLILCFAIPAHAAANTDAILDSLREGVTVHGQTVPIPASYVNQAENYFASHHISDDQAEYILGQVEAAKAAIQQSGVTDLKKLDKNTKNRILAAAQAAADEANLKLSVGSNKNVKIVDSSGNVTFTGENVIKTTGAAVEWKRSALFCASLISADLLLCSFLIFKYRLLEKKDESKTKS